MHTILWIYNYYEYYDLLFHFYNAQKMYVYKPTHCHGILCYALGELVVKCMNIIHISICIIIKIEHLNESCWWR